MSDTYRPGEQERQDYLYAQETRELWYQQHPEERPVKKPYVYVPWYKWVADMWRGILQLMHDGGHYGGKWK